MKKLTTGEIAFSVIVALVLGFFLSTQFFSQMAFERYGTDLIHSDLLGCIPGMGLSLLALGLYFLARVRHENKKANAKSEA